MPALSVIIPPGRIAAQLPDLLESLARQTVPLHEVLLVEAETSVGPAPTGRGPTGALPLRRIVSPGGLEGRAWFAETEGALIAFLDGEVLPQPQWAEAHVAGAARMPWAGLYLGAVDLALDGVEPEWLRLESDLFRRWLGHFDLGEADRLIDLDDESLSTLSCANLVIRRELLATLFEHGHPITDTVSLEAGGAPDVELVARARAHGGRLAYVGNARVNRRVPRDRLVPRWFVGRAFSEGRAIVRTLLALDGVASMEAVKAFGVSKGRELGGMLARLALMSVAFSRLPLRSRAEIAELMGIVVELEVQLESLCDCRPSLPPDAWSVLDGDVPDEFVSWLAEATDAFRVAR